MWVRRGSLLSRLGVRVYTGGKGRGGGEQQIPGCIRLSLQVFHKAFFLSVRIQGESEGNTCLNPDGVHIQMWSPMCICLFLLTGSGITAPPGGSEAGTYPVLRLTGRRNNGHLHQRGKGPLDFLEGPLLYSVF